MIRPATALVALLALTACSHESVRERREPTAASSHRARPRPAPPSASASVDPCAPTRTHDERDYTPGGLYRPGEADSGPVAGIDVSAIPEPVPRDEPRSRYGNRSPYTVLGHVYRVLDSAQGYVERGTASWYGS